MQNSTLRMSAPGSATVVAASGSSRFVSATDSNHSSTDVPYTPYTPENPLPAELQHLRQEGETVCAYCGVSYLIHTEMKALEERLRLTEAELATGRTAEERAKAAQRECAQLGDALTDAQRALEAALLEYGLALFIEYFTRVLIN